MTIIKEGRHAGEFLLSEDPAGRSRDAILLAAGSGSYEPNTVLGKITATRTWVKHDPTATDGSEVPAGILIYGCAVTESEPLPMAALVRDAQVKGVSLSLHALIDTPAERQAVFDQLKSLGVIVR